MSSAGTVDHPSVAGIPLVLGGNVFGWSCDEDRSFALLDAFYEAGGRMVDTADVYSAWVPGNSGGESESIIGARMEARGVRADMRIATKTGGGASGTLEPEAVTTALQRSLERLRSDYIDLFYIHRDDYITTLDEVVSVYDAAFRSGRTREIGVSNYAPERFADLNAAARRRGAQLFTAAQPHYNLITRDSYEGALQDFCVEQHIAVMPYYGLASGFLSGKYRSAHEWSSSLRAGVLDAAAANGGWAILDTLRTVAGELSATPSQVALAWINAQRGISCPIASATTLAQLAELVGAVTLMLSTEHRERLNSKIH